MRSNHLLTVLAFASTLASVLTSSMAQLAPAPAKADAKSSQKDVALIPRDTLFGNPDRASVKLSPDGTQIAFLAAVDGVLNVWVGPSGDHAAAKPVTDDKSRGIRNYFWAYTNSHIIYSQDKG